jgi:peptidoglycan L-alanyl-D-glutamate endopeptidase CwlK
MRSPLSIRDHQRLAGVHPDLVRVVERARLAVPFIVVEGLRSRERQAAETLALLTDLAGARP